MLYDFDAPLEIHATLRERRRRGATIEQNRRVVAHTNSTLLEPKHDFGPDSRERFGMRSDLSRGGVR